MSLSKLISCKHCGNTAQMEIIGTVNDTIDEVNPDYGYYGSYGTIYSVLKCPNPKCKEATIVSYYWNDNVESDDDITYKLLYPQKGNYPNGLPNNILSAYAAAESVKSIDVNAYTLLLRRVLEMVCLDRNAKHDVLANMLKELASKGEIPDKLVNVALGLKDFGNIGAHAGIGKLTDKEIPIVTALCNAILEYVYSAPYLAQLAEEKLKNIKSKN